MDQFLAAFKGNLQWFKENEYDVDARNHNWFYRTALMHASCNGHSEVCSLLLSQGASVDARSDETCTALIYGSQYGHVKTCALLLSAGASVDIHDNDGKPAIMYASCNGHFEVCALLLSQGASMDIRDKYGRTALSTASGYGHESTAALLERFSRRPRTLKYHMLKAKPVTSNKMLLKWNSYKKEINIR